MKKISVSLLSADFLDLKSEIRKIELCESVRSLHFDVMDGVFVHNISFGFPILKAVRSLTNMPISVHLMISDPLRYLVKFIDFGADEILVHINHDMDYFLKMLDICTKSGVKFGIAINPDECIDDFVQNLLLNIDSVLIMSVYPGFAGQTFIPSVLSKLDLLKNYDIVKKIDGGINLDILNYARGGLKNLVFPNDTDKECYVENLKYIDEFVIGSYFFNNIDKFIKKIIICPVDVK